MIVYRFFAGLKIQDRIRYWKRICDIPATKIPEECLTCHLKFGCLEAVTSGALEIKPEGIKDFHEHDFESQRVICVK